MSIIDIFKRREADRVGIADKYDEIEAEDKDGKETEVKIPETPSEQEPEKQE